MGFGQGLSGLNAASQNLDVIGNNIANSNTVGFKSASVSFADVYASSRVGLGVKVAAVNQRFTVGTVASTGGEFDIAIDGAKGFFRVTDSSGAVMYTRNGEYAMDKDYYIVNAQGYRLTGYPAGAVGANPVDLRIPQANISPNATTAVDFSTNLNANADVIPLVDTSGQIKLGPTNGAYDGTTYYFNVDAVTGDTMLTTDNAIPGTAAADGTYTDSAGNTITVAAGVVTGSINASSAGYMAYRVAVPFSPTDADSYTDSVPVTVYDTLGNSHQLVQYFIKRDPSPAAPNGTESQYGVVYYLDGQPVTTPAAETTMSFDKNGALLDPSTVNLTYAGIGGSTSPATDLTIAVNYTGTTQYGNDFNPKFTQDGYSSGEFMGIDIAKDGTVMATYTNGKSQSIGTIVLANFNNVQGLQPVGNNAWTETTESGQAILGQPGSNGLAGLQGQSLEQSNVNMSNELVNMIVAQRTYQANTQTIKTQDEILQTLMNI
jgi:flagellar hook protein FlgE